MSAGNVEALAARRAIGRTTPTDRSPATASDLKVRTRRSGARGALALLQDHARQDGTHLVPLRIFIGLGWLRAGVEKVVDPGWSDGASLTAFLRDRLQGGDVAFPPYETVITQLFLPHAASLSLIVLLGQFLAGAAILGGAFTRAALLGGLFMNLNFLLAGAPNPSAFYIVIQATLLVTGAGAVFGLDAVLARRVGVPSMVAQAAASRSWRTRPLALALVEGFWLGVAAYALANVSDWSPAGSVGDPAVLLAILAALGAAWTALAYLRRGRQAREGQSQTRMVVVPMPDRAMFTPFAGGSRSLARSPQGAAIDGPMAGAG
jgi:thiosulfate dehydrogenase [quinone] large subunit